MYIVNVFLLFTLIFSHTAWSHQPNPGRGMMSVGPLASRSVDSPTPISSPTFWGLGIIGEMDLSTNGGLEVALMYNENQYAVLSNNTEYLVERAHRLSIPLGYRHWFTKNFSLAISFYSAYRIGAWSQLYKSSALPSNINTSARDITEFGFDFSLQADLWQSKDYIVFLDSRFLSPSTDKFGENSRTYVFILGAKYQMQRGKN